MRSFLLAAIALGALSIAGGASATVFTADFSGPELDGNFTVTEPTGYVHTVGLGTVVVSSLAHPSIAGSGNYVLSEYQTGVLANDFFDAKLTVNISQLGTSTFYFEALGSYLASVSVANSDVLGYISFDPDNGDVDKTIPAPGNILTMEITHDPLATSVFVNNEKLTSFGRFDEPMSFAFGLRDWSGTAKTYTTAFVSNFTVTTPTVCTRGSVAPGTCGPVVPEPSTWALLLAGFGLTGGLLRARPWRDIAAA